MLFKLNQIVILGCFGRKKLKNKKKTFKKSQYRLGFNSLVVNAENIFLFLNRDIQFTLAHLERCKHHILILLRELFHRPKLNRLELFVSNLQHSLILSEKPRFVVQHILPILKQRFPIANVEIAQEAGAPFKIDINQLISSSCSYITLFVKFHDSFYVDGKFITVKFLKSKNNADATNVTLICVSLSSRVQQIIDFFEKKEWMLTK